MTIAVPPCFPRPGTGLSRIPTDPWPVTGPTVIHYSTRFRRPCSGTILKLCLYINSQNKLLISQDTEINNKKKNLGTKFNEYQINNFYLKFLEQAFSSKNINNNNIKKYLANAINKKDDEIEFNIKEFSLNSFFNETSNIIINAWSILFINNEQLNEHYLPYIFENENLVNGKKNLENDIFYITCKLSNELLDKNKDFEKTKNNILRISQQIANIIGKDNYLYNLSYDENYLIKKNLKTTNEMERAINEISIELNIINDIIKNLKIDNQPFMKYKELLSKELLRLNTENNKLRVDIYKKNIIKKLEEIVKDKKIIENLSKQINKIETSKKLKVYEELIDNYIIRYEEKNRKNAFKIFNTDEILLDDINNKNVKLIELLFKYSEIKDLIAEIKNNKETRLISLKRLYELIDANYSELFMNLFLQNVRDEKCKSNKDNDNILEASIYSMISKEIVDNELIESFIEFPNQANNLYDIKNNGKVDYNWCWNIEKKYNFDTKIYIPELNNLSFLYLFIRIKDFDSGERIKGNLIEDNELFNVFKRNFEDLIILEKKTELIFEIGNLLLSYYFHDRERKKNDLDSLCKKIKKYCSKAEYKAKNLLDNFLKYKNLYLNKSQTELLFDDLELNEKTKTKIFTTKYPSLINFLNLNHKIYIKLINQPSIINFSPEKNNKYIPLWLLCLRVLSNCANIKVSFKTKDKETLDLENIIENKIKNSINECKNLDWLLLITPNFTYLIENEMSERFYKYFNYLLVSLSKFSEKGKKELFSIIKKFIFNICINTFKEKNGINYILNNDQSIFQIIEEITYKMQLLSNIEFNKFKKGKTLNNLMLFFENLIDINNEDSLFKMKNRFQSNIQKFEIVYNQKEK